MSDPSIYIQITTLNASIQFQMSLRMTKGDLNHCISLSSEARNQTNNLLFTEVIRENGCPIMFALVFRCTVDDWMSHRALTNLQCMHLAKCQLETSEFTVYLL